MIEHYAPEDLVLGGPIHTGPVWDGWNIGHDDSAPITVAFNFIRQSYVVVDGMGHILAEGTPAELGGYMTRFLTALHRFEQQEAFPKREQPKSKLPAGKYGH